MQLDLAHDPDDRLRQAEASIHSALMILKKTLSTVPVDALGLSWRFTPRAQVSSIHMSSRQKLGLRVGTALLQQVHSTITQLRSQSISLAQSVARPSGEEEQTRTDATEEKAADRADQMCAIAFALERVSPELQDMVEELGEFYASSD
eukprot:1154627-Pelagomonas_calceolata.AAC.4